MAAEARWRQHVAVAIAFTAIWLVQAWPLPLQLGSVLPNDPGDPVLNTWILWWNAQALPLTSGWWNGPMFHPAPGSLAFSEILLGLSIVASPLQWLGASPIVAYNVVFLASTPLAAFFAYLLAWQLTGRAGPAIVAGVMFGFAVFRFAHVPHIQIMWSWWMPLALLGLHRWLVDERRRWSGLVVFALAWIGESLSNGYYFFYFSIVVGLWMAWFGRRRVVPALIAWVIAGLAIAPVMLTYRQIHGQYRFVRTATEIESGGADLTEFFRPSSVPVLFHIDRWERGEHEVSLPVLGILAMSFGLIIGAIQFGLVRRPWRQQRALATLQYLLFAIALICAVIAISTRTVGNWHFDAIGVHVSGIAKMLAVTWPALLLAIALSPAAERAWRERSVTAFYLGTTIIVIILAMGPDPKAWGEKFWNDGPYTWLMAIVPGMDGVRVPARFTILAVLCLAIFTALLLARLRFASASSYRERLVFGGVVVASLLETWPPAIPMATLPARPPAVTQDATVIELPFGILQETPALYRAMFHRRPLVDGYSGYFPPSHYAMLKCLARKSPECIPTLQRFVGPVEILIERQADPTGEWQAYASQLPDVQTRKGNAQFAVYRLGGAATSPRTFAHVPIKSVKATVSADRAALAIDGDWRTSWSSVRGQAAADALTIETDAATVTGVELWLTPATQHHYPRGVVIETSADGMHWQPAWDGPGDRVLFETVISSGMHGTRMTFPARAARFVRVTETLTDEAVPWSVVELSVLSQSGS
jgi:hypothetical protein